METTSNKFSFKYEERNFLQKPKIFLGFLGVCCEVVVVVVVVVGGGGGGKITFSPIVWNSLELC